MIESVYKFYKKLLNEPSFKEDLLKLRSKYPNRELTAEETKFFC